MSTHCKLPLPSVSNTWFLLPSVYGNVKLVGATAAPLNDNTPLLLYNLFVVVAPSNNSNSTPLFVSTKAEFKLANVFPELSIRDPLIFKSPLISKSTVGVVVFIPILLLA